MKQLVDQTQWVKGSRIPDMMFVIKDKLQQFRDEIPDADSKPFILIPDLVVEVISPGDDYSDVMAKVDNYLKDGVRLVWVVDPKLKTITVHVQGSNTQTKLSDDAVLDGGDVLPDFQLPLKDLFA